MGGLPRDIRRGQEITADFLNRSKNARPVNIRGGAGILVKQVGRELVIEAAGRQAPRTVGDLVSIVQVTAIQDDYVDAKLYSLVDGAVEVDEEIPVAKPYMLQQTPFDGQTISYSDGSSFSYVYTTQRERVATNTSDSSTETQVMTPDYYVGEILLAVAVQTGLTNSGGDSIELMDLNTAGRFWATEAS